MCDHNLEISLLEKVNLPQFAGTGYEAWKFRLRTLLQAEDLDYVLDRTEFSLSAKFRKADKRCMALIVRALADDHLIFAKDCNYSYEVLEKLDTVYEKSGTACRISLRRQWQSLKMAENGDLEAHFRKLDELTAQLKNAGCKVPETEQIEQLLMSLPASYDMTVEVLESIENVSMVTVRAKLRNQQEKLCSRVSDKNEDKPVEQSMLGHFHSGPSRFDKKMEEKRVFKCDKCGRLGHIAKYCRFPASSGHERDKGGNFNRFGGADKRSSSLVSCFKCGKRGHIARYCRSFDTKLKESSNLSEEVKTDDFLDATGFVSLMTAENKNEVRFCLDSGASAHYINDLNFYYEFQNLDDPKPVGIFKKNVIVKAMKVGKIRCLIGNDKFEFSNVYFSQDFPTNLLSVKCLNKQGISVLLSDEVITLINKVDERVIYKQDTKESNLYVMNLKIISGKSESAMLSGNVNELKLWHDRLGHINLGTLKTMSVKGLIPKLNFENVNFFCASCTYGKQTKLPHFPSNFRSKNILDLVHTDLVGPMQTTAYNGCRYILSFIDDFSNFVTVYILKSKGDVFNSFKAYYARTNNIFNRRIRELRCDNGREFVNNKMRTFCADKGIRIGNTVPYCPQMNGKAERFNRTIVERARTLLLDAQLERKYWPEAVLCATYLVNRVLNSKGDIPATLWYDREVDLSSLHKFGCEAFGLVPKVKRQDKLQEKSRKYVFVGYAFEGFRLLDRQTEKVVVLRDVKFNEFKSELLASDDCKKLEELEEKIVSVPLRSELDDAALYAFSMMEEGPSNFKDAMRSPEGKEWKMAIEEELAAIGENKVWSTVERPKDVKCLTTRWVFTKKKNGAFKARLVVRGFEENRYFSFYETYAPVVQMSSVRIFLALSLPFCREIRQLDVRNAFLNSRLKEPVYVEVPEGVKVSEGVQSPVLKLAGALYGLKESPKLWNSTLNECLSSIGFRRSKIDECFYVKEDQGREDLVYLVVYVDDMLICGQQRETVEAVIEKLQKKFKCKDLGTVKSFLGLEIAHDLRKDEIRLSQKGMIRKVADRFRIMECNPVHTPIEERLVIDLNEIKHQECEMGVVTEFKQLLGCLMYIMLGTRPDICYCVSFFGQFQNVANKNLVNYLMRVLCYLYTTINLDLVFRKTNNFELKMYVDADWANCPSSRKSFSGYCTFLSSNLIQWCTRKQSLVSLSTSDAEIIALCDATCSALSIFNLLKDLDMCFKHSVSIFEDNENCIRFAEGINRKSKHLDVKFYFVRELVENGTIKIYPIASCQQVADTLTKGLGPTLFVKFRSLLGLSLCD